MEKLFRDRNEKAIALGKYQSFLNSAEAFLQGKKDTNVYEDDCRSWFGTNAYLLFTLDRVIGALTKHVI